LPPVEGVAHDNRGDEESVSTLTIPTTADQLPPCELLELDPPCEVCDDTGEVTEAAGRAGRAILPCTNCNAYDVQQELLHDQFNESRED
jgi:hypothetical protein